jgi:DNA-binding NarL/FixJ family response regulator
VESWAIDMDLVVVWRLLRYGQPETRRQLVADLRQEGDPRVWHVLAETVRSREPWELRVRCLEALGFAAANADRALARQILTWTSGASSGQSRAETPAEPLTGREREIAVLVARGLSNRQIAERLAISPGTVNAHVQHILGKLSVPKRAAIGAWIGRQSTAATEPPLRERNPESVN